MKKLMLIVLLSAFATIGFSKDKYALIVAAGTYDRSTGWSSLTSANDVGLIKDALLARGFKEEEIEVLSEDVTKTNIIKAFNESLLNRAKKGDVVFFHFSGHGYQIPDDDGDEADGYDEALVPTDAVYDRGRFEDEAFYGNYLRDDDLGKMLDELRLKLGKTGNLMVCIDACHSGTATRGMSPARGIAREARNPADFKDTYTRGDANADFGFTPATGEMANMACFFASGENQLNYEYHTKEIQCGSLSYALAKALDETDAQVSYNALFDRVRGIMAGIVPRQTPHAEGEFDQVIFGGELLDKVDYLKVTKVESANEFQINAGKLSALHEGSIVGFYPADSRPGPEVQPLAKGVVISARTRDAVVSLTEGKLSEAEAKDAWVFVLEKNYGNMEVSLKIDARNKAARAQVEAMVSEYPYITVVDQVPVDLWLEIGLVEGKKSNELRLTTRSSHIYHSDDLSANDKSATLTEKQLKDVMDRVKAYAQSQYLRTFELPNPAYDVDIRFVPLQKKAGTTGRNPFNDYDVLDSTYFYKGAAQTPELEVGSYFRLEIINRSREPLYYSVIDIMPDNNMYVVFPAEGSTAQEYRVRGSAVEPNAKSIFLVGPPLGDDVIKLIVSKTPMDLSSIVSTRGTATRSGMKNFEQFFQNAFKEAEGTRGPQTVNVDVEDIGVYSFVYRIVDGRVVEK